ncbi:MAG TPA: hypothetical protein VLE73_04520 [Candidatus Saccharimonadales bacterium]|nr:hypothetical protein [Candidatus Saccharimonadales bacterium]
MDYNTPDAGADNFGRPQPPYQFPPHPGQPSKAPQYGAQQQHPQNPYQPVAYDNQGRPLYAHPSNQPQMMYFARPLDAKPQPLSEYIQRRHAESVKNFPSLNLSNGEYIISAVSRHPIGILRIWAAAFLVILALIGLFSVLFTQNTGSSVDTAFGTDVSSFNAIGIGVIAIMMILAAIGALIGTYVYNNNRFYLTNESVIQEIQNSLFSKHEQTVSLANIEDASFEQSGIIPTLLNYGRIRLSTEGDETTYRFNYVADPKKHIAVLNNAVEAFKNGRPVDPNEED